MIRIFFDPAALTQPEDVAWWQAWSKRAEAATMKALHAFEDWLEARPGTPFRFAFDASVWKELKDWLLENVFHQKCAYCEREISGYYGDAEHYRPKGAVSTGAAETPFCDIPDPSRGGMHKPKHPGYFWLAYDWRNLVPACVYCNSGQGKNERFDIGKEYVVLVKLEQGQVDAYGDAARPRPSLKWPGYYYLSPASLDEWENPLLINPLNAAEERDPRRHIRFGTRGVVTAVDDSRLGSTSIAVFQLKKEKLRQARQKAQERFRRDYYDAMRWIDPEHPERGAAKELLDEYRTGAVPFSAAALDYQKILRAAEEKLLET